MSSTAPPFRPSLLARLVSGALACLPKPVMRRFAGRYIAGEELDEALDKLGELAGLGHPGIIDILGENVTDEAEAREVLAAYKAAALGLGSRGLQAYVSVKPTHFGLSISSELALELYDELARYCSERGVFMRIEMEDHPTTDATLQIFEDLRPRHNNLGIVLQARLHRTPADIDRLAPGPINVRMVKGIYLEPAEIAHTGVEEIRESFVRCSEQLFNRGAFVSLATHDDVMVPDLERLLVQDNLKPDRYEFQVLLGVREPLWKTLQSAGHTVRVYVPYGPEWRAYSLRRLGKNPELLRAIVKNTLRWK